MLLCVLLKDLERLLNIDDDAPGLCFLIFFLLSYFTSGLQFFTKGRRGSEGVGVMLIVLK